MTLNYIIIDDEPMTHKLVENYAKELSNMQLAGNCYNGLEALNILNEGKADLIFLDINMPKLKGYDFLRALKHSIKVIVISAHKDYALEGYELNISDYLLKPFSFERFLQAVQKVLAESDRDSNTNNKETIFIKDEKKHHQVYLSDIQYIEASGNYAVVYLEKQTIISQMKISDFERLLPERQFIRTHRSFIVSKSKIKIIESNEIHLEKKKIPIGRSYKSNVDRLFL